MNETDVELLNKMTKDFIQRMRSRIYDGERDIIIAVCGGTGSGKSTVALWLAEALDLDIHGESRFDISRVVFGFNEWCNILKYDYPYGTAFVMEEPQTYFNSRMFNTKSNLVAVKKFSTGRVFRYITILTYPSFSRIDSQMRERIHFVIFTRGIDRKNKINFWQPMNVVAIKSNNTTEINYYPLTFSDEFSRHTMFCSSQIPSEKINKAYKEKSLYWKEQLKIGNVNDSGDIIQGESQNSDFEKIIDIRMKADTTRNSLRRVLDLAEIDRNHLWDCSTKKELRKRFPTYTEKVNRLWILIEEYQSNKILKDAKAEDLKQLDERA